MKQAEIWDINFNPTEGNEQRGIRPGVIISGNSMNDHLGLVIVCPLTSKVKNFMGNLILEVDEQNGLKQKSEVLVFQVRSVYKKRLKKYRGKITTAQYSQIVEGLNEILKY